MQTSDVSWSQGAKARPLILIVAEPEGSFCARLTSMKGALNKSNVKQDMSLFAFTDSISPCSKAQRSLTGLKQRIEGANP